MSARSLHSHVQLKSTFAAAAGPVLTVDVKITTSFVSMAPLPDVSSQYEEFPAMLHDNLSVSLIYRVKVRLLPDPGGVSRLT